MLFAWGSSGFGDGLIAAEEKGFSQFDAFGNFVSVDVRYKFLIAVVIHARYQPFITLALANEWALSWLLYLRQDVVNKELGDEGLEAIARRDDSKWTELELSILACI